MANAFGRTYSTRQTADGADIYDLNDGGAASGVAAGTYTNSTITVDETGRITSVSSGPSGDTQSKIIAYGVVGQNSSSDTLVNATVTNRWSSTGSDALYTDITVPSSANATVLATAENGLGGFGGEIATISVRYLGSNKYRFNTSSSQKKFYFAFIKE